MGKSTIDHIIDKIIVFAIGEDMIFGSLALLIISAFWAYRLWKTFTDKNKKASKRYLDLSENPIIYSMIIGLFAFTCFLVIQFQFHAYNNETHGILTSPP